ncbi:MAG: hypothetical protein H6R00_3665 [Proteobacteria bacterium]|nr:hypothetical protein [Pseudomonadota bacterium]
MTISTVKPLDIGRKFHADGKVRTYPGSTIVCHVAAEGALVARLDRLYERLRTASAAHAYTLLPPSSWHMTLFVGICDQDRRPDRWPGGIALDAPPTIGERLRQEPFGGPQRFRMRVARFAPLTDALILRLEPANEDENAAIRRLRDKIADRIGMRLADHDDYTFHITIGYFVGQPTDAAFVALADILAEELAEMRSNLPPFEVGPGEYCVFNDMFCFQRQFFIE